MKNVKTMRSHTLQCHEGLVTHKHTHTTTTTTMYAAAPYAMCVFDSNSMSPRFENTYGDKNKAMQSKSVLKIQIPFNYQLSSQLTRVTSVLWHFVHLMDMKHVTS